MTAKLVGRDPTPEMIEAGARGFTTCMGLPRLDDRRLMSELCWKDMHDAAPEAGAGRVAELEREVQQLRDKMTCMCGGEINHSGWEGHTPVSVYDYELDQANDRVAELERRIERALIKLEISVPQTPLAARAMANASAILRGEADA